MFSTLVWKLHQITWLKLCTLYLSLQLSSCLLIWWLRCSPTHMNEYRWLLLPTFFKKEKKSKHEQATVQIRKIRCDYTIQWKILVWISGNFQWRIGKFSSIWLLSEFPKCLVELFNFRIFENFEILVEWRALCIASVCSFAMNWTDINYWRTSVSLIALLIAEYRFSNDGPVNWTKNGVVNIVFSFFFTLGKGQESKYGFYL